MLFCERTTVRSSRTALVGQLLVKPGRERNGLNGTVDDLSEDQDTYVSPSFCLVLHGWMVLWKHPPRVTLGLVNVLQYTLHGTVRVSPYHRQYTTKHRWKVQRQMNRRQLPIRYVHTDSPWHDIYTRLLPHAYSWWTQGTSFFQDSGARMMHKVDLASAFQVRT